MLAILLVLVVLCAFLVCTSNTERERVGAWDDDDNFDEEERDFFLTGGDSDIRHLKVDSETFKVIKDKTMDARGGRADKFDDVETIVYYDQDRDNGVSFKITAREHVGDLDTFLKKHLKKNYDKFFPTTKSAEEAEAMIREFYTDDRIARMGGIVVLYIEPV